eukprot:scaffold4046_cov187-Amphora_coffeaeformis.AAC.3
MSVNKSLSARGGQIGTTVIFTSAASFIAKMKKKKNLSSSVVASCGHNLISAQREQFGFLSPWSFSLLADSFTPFKLAA